MCGVPSLHYTTRDSVAIEKHTKLQLSLVSPRALSPGVNYVFDCKLNGGVLKFTRSAIIDSSASMVSCEIQGL